MKSKQNQQILHSKTSYQIKNQNIYNQKKYPLLNEIIPKNSILNKVKYKPDFSIGQYFKNKEKVSEVINLKNKPNYISKVRNIGKNSNDILDNELNEWEFFYNDVNLDDLNSIKTKGNFISQKILTERNNNRYKSKIFNKYNPNNDDQNYYLQTERKIDKINNDYEYDVLNTDNNYNNYGYMNLDENNLNNNNYRKKDLYLNIKSNNNYGFIPNLNTKIKDWNNIYSKEYSEDKKIDSFRVRFINTNKANKKKRYFYNIDFTNNNNINIKLEEYRIKLFREFYKHFKQFYMNKLEKYFKYFIKKVYNNNEANNYNYFFNKRIKNNKNIYINSNKVINLPKFDFKDVYKQSSIKDNFLKKINKNYIYQIINNTNNINNSTFNISKNNINNITNNNTSSTYSRNNYLKSAPKSNENRTKNLIDNSLSFSSSFQIGNTTIVNRNISFKNESNENELFRDSKELKRKFNQIKTRKERSTSKNDNSFTTRADDNHLKLEEIRKYMKLTKKSREKKSNKKGKNKNKDKDNNYENNDNISYQTQNKSINKKETSTENISIEKSNSKKSLNDINLNKYNTDNTYKNDNNKNIKNEKNKMGRIPNIKNFANNKVFSDNKKENISLPYKYDIYPSRKIFKTYTKLIKNIITEDKRIYININYFFLERNKKPSIKRYNFVHPCDKISICLKGDNNNKLKISNLKENLSEIKEEEGKSQKIYSKEKMDEKTNHKSVYQRYKKKQNKNVET